MGATASSHGEADIRRCNRHALEAHPSASAASAIGASSRRRRRYVNDGDLAEPANASAAKRNFATLPRCPLARKQTLAPAIGDRSLLAPED